VSTTEPHHRRDDDDMAANGVPRHVFDAMYEKTPPWDIGRPQPEIVRLAGAGEITGDVLDVGCGPGDSAIFLAQRGHRVLGVDFSERPIDRARAKSAGRSLSVEFRVLDALNLASLKRRFDTIIDCGLFHTFSDAQRPVFVESLAAAIKPGGRLILMCFSEAETRDRGPRRVTQAELLAAFADGWRIERIEPTRFAVNPEMFADGARAWLAVITRT
jgi:2-polyprenyl-3-methyl-5-hydroxy-6-metoxy-1,4-benzoquinol methylase